LVEDRGAKRLYRLNVEMISDCAKKPTILTVFVPSQARSIPQPQ
jgi:hypothetical protein